METFTFVFTGEEANRIFEALAERPFKEVAPLIDNMNMQIQAARAEKAARESGEKEENKE